MSACRSCKAEIRWAKTEAGKAMPLDPTPTADGNVIIVGGIARVLAKGTLVPLGTDRYMAHWATCPTSYEHRRVAR
jgi:hypothetical protein